jgi:hypothetical protein
MPGLHMGKIGKAIERQKGAPPIFRCSVILTAKIAGEYEHFPANDPTDRKSWGRSMKQVRGRTYGLHLS